MADMKKVYDDLIIINLYMFQSSFQIYFSRFENLVSLSFLEIKNI